MSTNESPEVGLRERVKEPPSERLVESYYRPNVARAVAFAFNHEMWIHLAHALMLERQGIVAPAAISAILSCVLNIADAGPDAVPIDYRQEDLYSYTEREIIRRLGPDIGGRLHTGRSRNDLHTTAWRMVLRDMLVDVMDALGRLRGAVLAGAERYAETVMPGYTHAQHAQPVTFGYYLLSYADHLARDHRRLAGALAHTDCCPLGAGALTTTAFPLDRPWIADALGFAAPLEIAYDAVASRDDAAEAVAACALLSTGLSRVATDLQAWSTWEYRFLELADRHSAVSSIMPQKKNPAALEHIKASAGMITGSLAATLACMKNTAFGDVNDAVSAINEPVLDAATRSRRILLLAAEVLDGLTVFPDRMKQAAVEGFGSATELADVIVRETGLSFRMAHNVVAGVVRFALESGRSADSIRTADLDVVAETLFGSKLGIGEPAVAEALDPAANIRARTILGGPAPGSIRRMLAARQQALADDTTVLTAVSTRVAGARTRTVELARAGAGGN